MRQLLVISTAFLSVINADMLRDVRNLMSWYPDLNITKSFLDSNCGDILKNALNSYSGNISLFIPTDAAWRSTFNLSNFQGFGSGSCRGRYGANRNSTNCYELLSRNLSSLGINELEPCLPYISLYHLGYEYYPMDHSCPTTNMTIIPSFLNQTLNLSQNRTRQTQDIVVNCTKCDTFFTSGGNQTAKMVGESRGPKGMLHLIDRVLIPPMPLNYTLVSLNLTDLSSLNQAMIRTNSSMNQSITELELTKNYTVFWPGSPNPQFNASSYIIPELVYLNSSGPMEYNLTAIDGSRLTLNITNNTTAYVNGTTPVVTPNIPLVNGILHLINSTHLGQGYNKTHGSRSLFDNMNLWVRLNR